jgi:hypothetical protein
VGDDDSSFRQELVATSPATAQERESILDRGVYLEDSVITGIPSTPRLEEALGHRTRVAPDPLEGIQA